MEQQVDAAQYDALQCSFVSLPRIESSQYAPTPLPRLLSRGLCAGAVRGGDRLPTIEGEEPGRRGFLVGNYNAVDRLIVETTTEFEDPNRDEVQQHVLPHEMHTRVVYENWLYG